MTHAHVIPDVRDRISVTRFAEHPVTAWLADLSRGLSPSAGSTRIITVDGPLRSGKTAWGTALAEALDAPVVHVADLCPGWAGLSEIGFLLQNWVVDPLRRGEDPRWPHYDWTAERYTGWSQVDRDDFLVVEGSGAGSRLTAPRSSLLLWVDAPREERTRRLQCSARPPRYASHLAAWQEQEQELLTHERTEARADLRLDNTRTVGLTAVSPRGRALLAGEVPRPRARRRPA